MKKKPGVEDLAPAGKRRKPDCRMVTSEEKESEEKEETDDDEEEAE